MAGAVLLVAACGGGAPASAPAGEAILIRERVVIANESGAEIIATGDVLEGSTLGSQPFCAGGTIKDTHGSGDPALWLIVHSITCADGTLTLAFAPDLSQDAGSWIAVGGTGVYEGIRGSGRQAVVYGPNPDSPADVTYTGVITR